MADFVNARGKRLRQMILIIGIGDRIHRRQEGVDPLPRQRRARKGGKQRLCAQQAHERAAPRWIIIIIRHQSIQQRFIALGDRFNGGIGKRPPVKAAKIADIVGQQSAHFAETLVKIRILPIHLIYE